MSHSTWLGACQRKKELAAFEQNPDRSRVIDGLLASRQHRVFWSQLWTSLLVGREEVRYVEREVLRSWLEASFENDVALNQMVFQLISADGVTSLNGPANYVAASESDPVMRLSRTFLSVQLDCAQCHDHPHDRWTHDDYLAMQRFFQLTRYREVPAASRFPMTEPIPTTRSRCF